MANTSIEFAPISGALGALVSGVDFASELPAASVKALQEVTDRGFTVHG